MCCPLRVRRVRYNAAIASARDSPQLGRAMLQLVFLSALFASSGAARTDTTVVLLHGLAVPSMTMHPIARHLSDAGYHVLNIGYPSRSHELDSLAEHVIERIRDEVPHPDTPLYFVTHSMGGIVLRILSEHPDAPPIKRAVMLGPPNHGSEIIDRTRDWWIFDVVIGPAGAQIGTDQESIPNSLPAPSFEFGVIAGSGEPSLLFSGVLPGDDDGKVTVVSTRLEGMSDHIVLPIGHTALLARSEVHEQIVTFLRTGAFDHSDADE